MSRRRVLIIETQIKQYRERFFVELARRLALENVDLKVLYSAAYGAERTKRDTIDLAPELGIKVPGVWLFGGRLLVQPVLQHVREADLVITEQGNRLLFNYVLLGMSQLGLKRIAFWGHGYNHQARGRSVSEWLKRRLVSRVDWWFAYTEGVARYLAGHGVDADTITVVQNTIDTSELGASLAEIDEVGRDRIRAQLGIPRTSPVALFCGSLYADKKLGFLIDAIRAVQREIPAVHLVVVGDGPDRALVEAAAAELPYVHCIGPAFGPERAAYFAIADVFLMPDLVGVAIVDAFAAGLPVVTTDAPLHGPEIEYVRPGENGVITRHVTGDYSAAVTALVSDRQQLGALRRGARATAARLTLSHMVDAFADGIVRALAETP